jgi:hypothetical protein
MVAQKGHNSESFVGLSEAHFVRQDHPPAVLGEKAV